MNKLKSMPDNQVQHEAAAALSAVSYLAGLDADAIEMVAAAAIRRDYDVGQVVVVAGQPDTGM